MELPEECWESIFRSADHHRYHESLSLVSTSFLAITDRLRTTLNITDQTVSFLPRLLRRFRNLKRIKFCNFRGNLASVLIQISLSALDLESIDVSGAENFKDMAKSGLRMRNLKELKCSGVKDLGDSDLVGIRMCFPFLEELDMSYPVPSHSHSTTYISDSGIINLSSTLKRLSKIDISGNNFITDKALVTLSHNCVLLREIALNHCDLITQDCVSFVLLNSQNLKSIAVSGIWLDPRKPLSFPGSLSEIEISSSYISDELLRLMADANFPLKKLVLSGSFCYTTYDGILYLLSKYKNLVHLDLEGARFLSDEMIMELGIYIRGLTSLNLNLCDKLTGLAFFSIIQHCPRLKCVRMEYTNLGMEGNFSGKQEIIKTGIQSLYISKSNNLSDKGLKKILYHCPHLELLGLNQCPSITGYGIREITKNCPKIRTLDIWRCIGIMNLPVDFDLPKLETLRATSTMIGDEALEMISRRCPNLQNLDLEECLNVTSRGVKELARKCTRLRKVNLWDCGINEEILTWMVCVSSSLRYIVHRCSLELTRDQRIFFLRHGCVICNYREDNDALD